MKQEIIKKEELKEEMIESLDKVENNYILAVIAGIILGKIIWWDPVKKVFFVDEEITE